ncbi:MAG TPA: sigma 54-interacting transcriptional regulator [Polyangiaceae bacterium]|nr:sigma 54-interacting transcriptional regulator [Polyangiaceae bacterium]
MIPSSETVASKAAPAKRVAGARLRAVSGPGKDRGLSLTRATATVGRHATCDLALPDPRVSGVHLQVSVEGASIRVRDQQSTNGTWLGGARVRDLDVPIGTELLVGDTVLLVEADPSAQAQEEPRDEGFGALVGTSRAMRELFALLTRVASKDLTILLLGETGTGKEEVARAVHAASPRAAGPFTVVDCTALPESLADALLFGFERGSFTGASERRAGFFEAAQGGTLLLDEVGELAPALQAKFLRVLERREAVRVGSQTPLPLDVRVIAATNRDLRLEIERGRFREDLYFRLAGVRVTLPPLRERPEDIPLLCRTILARSGSEAMIEHEALGYLAEQTWPGNVRELANALHRGAALTDDGIIRRGDVSGEGFGARADAAPPSQIVGTFAEAKEHTIARFERDYLAVLMRRCRGNLSRAAREADVARHHLRDLLKKRGLYGLDHGDE